MNAVKVVVYLATKCNDLQMVVGYTCMQAY